MNITRRDVSRWLLGGVAFAMTMAPGIARADSVQVVLNGNPLDFDVPPVIEQNVTMVPIRAVLTPLGASFAWDGEAQRVTVTMGETEIKAEVGSSTARVNGQQTPLAMPVLNLEGRIMIPLRFFAEELGFKVEWEGETHTVLLSRPEVVSREPARVATVSREVSRRQVEMVLTRAQELIGLPYAWGGTSPETGFDCSGFVTYLAGQVGAELPRTSFEMFSVGTVIEQADLAAGDLVFFTTYAEGASHVAVYDGAGGFIHAQSPEVGVVRTPMSNSWWSSRYIGARRVFR